MRRGGNVVVVLVALAACHAAPEPVAPVTVVLAPAAPVPMAAAVRARYPS